ncbi:MAG: flavodoxin domain-containing protein [Psychrobium sp.]
MLTINKQFFRRFSLSTQLIGWLRWALLSNVLLCGFIALLMWGMWFEFATPLYLTTERLTELSQAVISLKSSDNALLMTFSMRDSSALIALMGLWKLNLFVVIALCVAMLVQRLFTSTMLIVTGGCIAVLALSLTALPPEITGQYVGLLGLVLLASTAAFYRLKALRKQLALAPKSQTLIAYASQSGTAKSIALNMAKSVHKHADIRAFADVSVDCLQDYQRLLVVAATYGEGEAPEKALDFPAELSHSKTPLSHLRFAVLALGDRAYPQFCAFGHRMAQLLSDKSARAIRAVEEVDRADSAVVARWWNAICDEFGWQSQSINKTWQRGVMVENTCLNSQQPQRPAHAIAIKIDGAQYQAGDLLEILTPTPITLIDDRLLEYGLDPQTIVRFNGQACALNHALTQLEWTNQVANSAQALVDKLSQLRARVYSIASAPNDSAVRLLVRHLKKDDGSDGYCSSLLCNAQVDSEYDVAIRTHDSFRLPSDNAPIIMIGAGTGIAPFMSFLAQRQQNNITENWLIFGEQYSSHDNYFNDDLDRYLEDGFLSRMDYAFSRDAQWLSYGKPRYVNDVISTQGIQIQHWLYDKGAHIFVCGNKAGMGESVKDALRSLLKQDYLRFKQEGRLHFDLY